VKLVRTPGPHPALIFVAPALDVVLVLVFFVVLSTSFLLQPGIAVNVPESPFLLAPQRDPQVVSITGPPVSRTFFEDEQVTPAALRAKLSAQKGLKRTVVIKADRRAPIEDVTAVLTIALELGYPAVIATAEGR